MNKKILYIILGAVLAICLVFLIGNAPGGEGENGARRRKLDKRLSFRAKDKVPYGTYIAYNALGSSFPGAVITTNTKSPGFWETISSDQSDQLLMIVSPHFTADDYELRRLREFVENGNDVLISAYNWSKEAEKFFGITVSTALFITDSLRVQLQIDSSRKQSYGYAGSSYDGYLSKYDTEYATVLGRDNHNRANFIRMTIGKGRFLVHTEPFALTNYFLLSNQNFNYYEGLVSTVAPGVKKIAWDEYFLKSRNDNKNDNERKGWLKTLMTMENSEGRRSFGTAVYILLALLAFYALMEMRRKQRQIPVIRPPANDSLDFVKTIGRLYHEKSDHANLARKMSAYFLEHVRSRYNLPTANLDESFIRLLQAKSGADGRLVEDIVEYIRRIERLEAISAQTLTSFHKKLESFYKIA